jgi:flagellar hook-associated protein 2
MSIGSTNLSLPGLSGFDFSAIVQAMVNNYSQPLNKMQEQQSVLQTKKDAWRDVNTRLSSLEKTLEKLRDSSTWAGTKASSSKPDILAVSSTSGTTQGTYNIKVVQMAVAQTAVSKTIEVADPAASTAISAGSFAIQVGDKTAQIIVQSGDSLEEIAKAINNSKIGVNASVIQVDGGYRLALLSAETGLEKAATFSELNGGSVLHDLGILRDDQSLNISQQAKDAKLEINGITQITSAENKITTAVPGLTLTINDEAVDTTVTVKVSADYSGAESTVKSFVDQYNSVMSFIEGKLKYDKDLKTKGDLFADPALQSIQSRLRTMVSGKLNNPSESFKILADVGITTSADNFGKSAALSFDTAKFNEALTENASSVANLFGAAAGGVEPYRESTQSQSAQGLGNILYEYLRPLVRYEGTLDKASKGYDKQLAELKDKMVDFTEKVERYAETTRLKFVRLETQLAALSSQSEWLQGQIDSLNAFYNKK